MYMSRQIIAIIPNLTKKMSCYIPFSRNLFCFAGEKNDIQRQSGQYVFAQDSSVSEPAGETPKLVM